MLKSFWSLSGCGQAALEVLPRNRAEQGKVCDAGHPLHPGPSELPWDQPSPMGNWRPPLLTFWASFFSIHPLRRCRKWGGSGWVNTDGDHQEVRGGGGWDHGKGNIDRKSGQSAKD